MDKENITKFFYCIGFLFAFVFLIMPVSANTVRISASPDSVRAEFNNKPLFYYRYKNVPKKPYLQQLVTLGFQNVLRDQVEDHPHHHGLMFALGVNGISFWEESDNGGTQIHKSFTSTHVETTDELSRFHIGETLEWQSPQGEILLLENRDILCTPQPKLEAVFLRWTSVLRCPDERNSVEISGSHYYGLGMRFPQNWDEIGAFTNSENAEGTIFRGEERLTDAKWCFYTVPNTVSVGMFDSPTNPKPSTWFTMIKPFAYLSATLRYHENKIILKAGESITLTYGLAVTDRVLSKEEMAALYEEWVESN